MSIGQNSCGKNIGGIRSIELLPPEAIAKADYYAATDEYDFVELAEGFEPTTLHFTEGSGRWVERAEGVGGPVVHRVECRLRGVQPAALVKLQRLALNGVVALVTTESGEEYLVGYSPEAHTDYPLRLAEGQTDSSKERSEGASTLLVLTSTDGWFSRPIAQ